MKCLLAGLLLTLGGCSLLFESDNSVSIDAGLGVQPDACVGPTASDDYPAIPEGAYYVRPGGTDDVAAGLSLDGAWATFAFAMDQLEPGDTLVLGSSIYNEQLDIDMDVAGTPGLPITIMAAQDGKAEIRGNGAHTPCRLRDTHDIVLLGIRCVEDDTYALFVDNSENVTLRRVSASNSAATNFALYRIGNSTSVLLEDVSAIGANDTLITLVNNTAVELRRIWALSSSTANQYVVNSDACDRCLLQNLIVRSTNAAATFGILLNRSDAAQNTADGTKLLGSLIYNQRHNGIVTSSVMNPVAETTIEHVVIARSGSGVFQRSVKNLTIHHTNLVNLGTASGDSVLSINDQDNTPVDEEHELNVDLRDSILSGGNRPINVGGFENVASITAAYNVIFGHQQASSTGSIPIEMDSTNLNVDPDFAVMAHGLGGFLMQPEALKTMGENGGAIGAEILYRYESGSLTPAPLWPWPMEDRILEETGYTVTWETGESGEQGEGVWRDLDLVYPACVP